MIPSILLAVLAPKVHTVNMAVTKDVAPSSKIQISINTQNLQAIHVSATPIDPVKWLTYEEATGKCPGTDRQPTQRWQLTIAAKGQLPNPNQADTYYSRQINLPPMKPGVYLLKSAEGDKPAWAVVNVTDLAVIVKRSPRHALVWVTDFKTGRVVSGASVGYYRTNGALAERVATHADGAVVMTLPPSDGTVLVRRGQDYAGIPSSQQNPDGRLVAHFQTDRPIYRPGQDVSFKALLRRTKGQGYSVAASNLCTIQLRDPKDNPLDELKMTSSSMGSVSGQFSIPNEAMTGAYTLVLKTGEDTAFQTLTVAEYRKPEFKVEVSPAARRYLSGEELTFNLNSAYYFGAPVPQAQIHYTVRRQDRGFGGFDSVTGAFYSGDGNLYARDTYRANPFVAEDSAFTDNAGKAVIHINSDKDAPDSTYIFTCTVADSSRRQVSGDASVSVYSANVRIGLTSSLLYASVGTMIPVQIRAIDLDGHPTSANVELELKKPIFDEKTGQNKEILVTGTSVKVGSNGSYAIKLPAKEEGELRIYARAKDDTGRYAKAFMEIYVAGNFEKPAKGVQEPSVGIRLDKRAYEAADLAKAFVTTNNPHRPILEVLEGGDIWDYRVVPNPSGGQTWSIPVAVNLAPNAYVAAEQWVKGRLVSGNVMLPVPDRSKLLKVAISSDKPSYHPGDTATYHIHAADGHDRPVEAEVALAVVDEAIYALSPESTEDLYGLYWGLRPNSVSMEASAPEELSGGAYQRVNAVAPVRQRFEDTAFWGPAVLTDAQGNATVKFEMPGNLTAWRATGRAVTMDTAVGTGTNTVQANRPVTLRLATPRQMVVGDRLTLIGIVDNRSTESHDFEVRLDGVGVDVGGGNTQKLSLKAKSEGKVQWVLEAKSIPADAKASLSGQVEATDAPGADNADALKVSVPIVPNGLPERFETGGSIQQKADATLDLPSDRLEPATVATITVWAGVRPAMIADANEVLDNPRYGSVGATNQIQVAIALGLSNRDDHVRESLALLSRTQKNDGWGWWENAPTDPLLTARTLSVLAQAKATGMQVFDTLLNPAKEAAVAAYNNTNLWENRAILAAASALASDSRGKTELDEVVNRGESLSPFAKLRLARGYIALNESDSAKKILTEVITNASPGDTETYVPGGEGIGWSASDVETTAEALGTLALLDVDPDVQPKLARWLVSSDREWMSIEEKSDVVAALNLYLRKHVETIKLGHVTATCNGTTLDLKPSVGGESLSGSIPLSALHDGSNAIAIQKDSGGEALYSVSARVFRPVTGESTHGVRILRRFEVKNAGGTWVELNRAVRPGEPVRCTTLAWGDDLRDAVKVSEPLPAGFEFIEDSSETADYKEVRDGAVIHYTLNSGTPQTFRFFLRAETEGKLVSLPATAEYLRRPNARGNTIPMTIDVVEVSQ